MKKKTNVIVLMALPDCNDDLNNLKIAGDHKLTPAVHDTMVSSFFGGANPAPKTLLMNDPVIDFTLDCQFYGIKMKFDAADHTTNQDITISMALISSLSAPHADYFVMFSIHLFKGLKIGKSVAKLELRKAYSVQGGTNVPTIALKGFDANNNIVYNGDLTHMHPHK